MLRQSKRHAEGDHDLEKPGKPIRREQEGADAQRQANSKDHVASERGREEGPVSGTAVFPSFEQVSGFLLLTTKSL